MGSLPEGWTTPSPYSLRQFSALSRNVNGQNDQIIWGNAYTVASSPIPAIADGVAEVSRLWANAAQFTASTFRYRNDADFVAYTSLLWNLKGPINPNDEWSGGEWASEILPKNKTLGPGGDAFDISAAAKKHATQFNVQATVKGYAYSPSGMIQVAMMIVPGVYIVVFVSHLIFINLKGDSSGSWTSAAEMTASAMNSNYTAELENTTAGISTMQVCGANVTIRRREERLQFVFHSSALQARGYYIKENVAYA